MIKRLAFLTALVVGLLAMAGTASAGTIKVTTTLDELDAVADSTCSLREAISTANTDANTGGCTDPNNATADTVSLSGADYRLSLPGPGSDEDNNSFGDLDVTENLTIQGAGAEFTGIDGNGALMVERVLHLTAGNLTLRGVRVYGGNAPANGGGILAVNSLTLVDSAVNSNNSASKGGGIEASGVTLTRSSVSGNHAAVSGGGIDANLAHLTDSTVSHNSTANGGGGGIAAQVTMTRSTVSDNLAAGPGAPGGGGVLGGGTLTDSRIVRNQAGQGGGIFIVNGSLTITRSTISGNKANSFAGGGLGLSSAGTYTIKNTTVSGNSSVSVGGGLAIQAGTAIINNATIARNTAEADGAGGEGGGGVAQFASGVLRLRNSLVAENATLGGGSPDCFGTLNSPSYDAFTTAGGCIVTGTSVGVILGGSPIGGLLDNGGLTPTHELLPGNLAIDAGYPGTGAGVPCEAKDQRGLPRAGGAGRCDIGAFEVQP